MSDTIDRLVEMLANEQRARIAAEDDIRNIAASYEAKLAKRHTPDHEDVSRQIASLAGPERKINAIKLHRSIFNSDLKAAKEAIERHL